LEGVSFTILPFEERDSVLRDFAGLLASAKRGVLLARREEYDYTYSTYLFRVTDTLFYLKAPAGVQVVHFNPKPEEPRRPRAKRLVNPVTLELEDGSYARVLVAYKFPASLPEGFLYTLFTEVSEVALVFTEVERARAMRMIETARKRRVTGGGAGVTEAYEAEELANLATRVLAGSSLFEFYLYFIVKDKDLRALNTRANTLRSLLKGYGVDVDAPPLQRGLYNLETCLGVICVEKHYADSESLKPLIPLISEELHDENGVFLGVSGTGSPVLLDVWSKPNLNFVIVGVTGSGKSMTAKVYLKRLRELDKRILYVGVDPESEYTRVAGLIGAQAVEIYENQRLGLDPIRLLRSGALELGQVADIISEVYGVPEHLQGVLRRELFMNADFVDTFTELAVTIRDPELSKYLQGATVPPDSYVYEGEPPPLAGSVVFGLKNVRSKRLKILISALISSHSYNTLLSKTRRSVFFVDEAWLFMETPSIVSLFENLARRGRKHGAAFLYITQRAEDLARTPQGRTILEQSATVLLLRQEPEGRDACKEIYKLSDSEAEYLVNAPTGSGILKAGRKRITMQVLPTEEELRAFSTTVA
jgi:type IV secretion system protein VirB4